MRKTTVYLDDDEAEALRQLAAETGVSQAGLIRDAIRRALVKTRGRRFHSLGRGQGTATDVRRWSPAEVYDKAFGEL